MSHGVKRDSESFSDEERSSIKKKRYSKHNEKIRNKDAQKTEHLGNISWSPPVEERTEKHDARRDHRRHRESARNVNESRHNLREELSDSKSFIKSRDKEKSTNSRENRRGGERRNSQNDQLRRIKQESADDFTRQRQLNDQRRMEARQQQDRGRVQSSFGDSDAVESVEKEQPNFELSGKLTEDTNVYRGVVIKYNEPSEARKPKRRWRLYPFKGDTALPMLPVHRQSAYLLGRDRRIADIPIDHPSCSKQHAVLQYRLTDYHRPDGSLGRKVRPYVIDLGSANGTFINNKQIDSQRYVELMERDVIKFGFSSREYVLLHENVDTSEVAHEDDSGSN